MLFSRRRSFYLAAAAVLALLLPPLYLWQVGPQHSSGEAVQVLTQYLRAVYARDFSQAYQFISLQDRGLKKEHTYVRERGAFTGFPLEVTRKLAEAIQIRPIQEHSGNDGRVHIRIAYRVPDANAVAALVFDWDEERLSSVSDTERRKILDELEHLTRRGNLRMIDGEEAFVLVQESAGWKMFLDWASGIHVRFNALAPADWAIEARPEVPETIVHPGDLFTVEYAVKNRSSRDLRARIVHRVEPKAVGEYLDLVECALLLPVRVPAGTEQRYASTYLLRGDLHRHQVRIGRGETHGRCPAVHAALRYRVVFGAVWVPQRSADRPRPTRPT
jgi:hypothetical protein